MNGAILEGTRTPRVAIAAWLVGLAGCIAIVANTREFHAAVLNGALE